ncbi:MAG TPA: hypothetical protein VF060_06425 [Trebonia sp.]
MMRIRRLVALAAAGASLAGVAACSASAHSAPPGTTGTTCGTTRTGANVPVVVKVTKGSVSCADVMRVESGYATVIKDGKVPGNGGGAPVQVSGWTCQGYPTPEVLRTGNASECHTASAEVVAVVELPSSSGS